MNPLPTTIQCPKCRVPREYTNAVVREMGKGRRSVRGKCVQCKAPLLKVVLAEKVKPEEPK